MRGFVFVMIIVLLWDVKYVDTMSTILPPTSTATTPTLTFECDSKGHINSITGIDNKKLVWENGGNYCHLSDIGCHWQNQNNLRIFYDDNEIESKIIAARHVHFYELYCNTTYDISLTAMKFQIESKAFSTTPTYIPLATYISSTITLSILKEGALLTKPVFIGEQLLLQFTGPENYTIDPTKCTAFDGTQNSVGYILWERTNCSSKDKAIMDDKWTQNKNVTSIPLYAFKFVGSDSVTIECSAHVCLKPDCNLTCGQGNGRRRRGTNIESRFMPKLNEESARASFTIRHLDNNSNNSAGLSMSLMIYLLAIVASRSMIVG